MKNVTSEDGHERQIRRAEQTVDCRDRKQSEDPRAISHVLETLNQLVPERPPVTNRAYFIGSRGSTWLIEADHRERDDHRNERQPISIETAREREQPETDTGKHRTDNARELKLCRIERDRVCQIFAPNQIERHRLIRWTG